MPANYSPDIISLHGDVLLSNSAFLISFFTIITGGHGCTVDAREATTTEELVIFKINFYSNNLCLQTKTDDETCVTTTNDTES